MESAIVGSARDTLVRAVTLHTAEKWTEALVWFGRIGLVTADLTVGQLPGGYFNTHASV